MTSKELDYAVDSLMELAKDRENKLTMRHYDLIEIRMRNLIICTGASILHGLPETRSQVELYYDIINKVQNFLWFGEVFDIIENYNKVFDKMLVFTDGK